MMREEVVLRRRWLGDGAFLDLVSATNLIPGPNSTELAIHIGHRRRGFAGLLVAGPVFSTATFIGYILLGGAGAIVATAGIFLPAFVFVAVSGPLVPRLRASPLASAFLEGVNAASLALMAVVSFALLRAAVTDVVGGGVFVVTVMLLWRTRVNPTWLIAGGAVLGGARQLLSTVVAP